jgi:hypothetical protein
VRFKLSPTFLFFCLLLFFFYPLLANCTYKFKLNGLGFTLALARM